MARSLCLSLLPLCFVASCSFGAPPDPASQGNSAGMRYRELVRDKAGKYRLGSPSEPGDVKVYVFAVHVDDLQASGQDELLQARRFLEFKKATPVECLGRYRITKIGQLEGGNRTINVECADAP